MGDHKRSKRFSGLGFDMEILEESTDRHHIEKREEYWIKKYDSYENGLNETWSGKGWGHKSPNFTTLGYVYSEESRKKMSESAKRRAKREGHEVRSKRSKANYQNPEYLKKQKESKKGKRLRPPKLTDEQVEKIRDHFEKISHELEIECKEINKERHKKNSGWTKTNPAQLFGSKYSGYYNVSLTLLRDIVLWKTRTKVLPELYKKKSNENSNA